MNLSDKVDFYSDNSLSSFSISQSIEEEEEEFNEDEESKSLSNDPPLHLHCHPDDDLPTVAIGMCEQLFHAECNRCANCTKQITRGKAFLKEIDNDNNLKILCIDCARQKEKERIACRVCREEIKKEEISNKKERKNTAVLLAKNFYVHKECLHCQICGLSEGKSFQCVKNKEKTKKYIICLDCASIMNGGGTSKNLPPFVGRFINEILPSTFCKQCQNCHHTLSCDGFVFANQRILCVNCGKSFFQVNSPKKNQSRI